MYKIIFNYNKGIRVVKDGYPHPSNGAGRPLGLLNAPGTIVIAPEASQNPDTVVSANILKMVAALSDDSQQSAAWIVNKETQPQLQSLTEPVGGSALPLWQWRSGGEKYNKLCGFDVLVNEYRSKLGDKGDIFLADFSKYAIIEKRLNETISAHLYFLTDESAMRLVYRFDGQPVVNNPVVPKHGATGALQSPYITLAAR